MTPGQVEDPIGWRLLLGNVFFALFWLPVRFFVGRDWLSAGWHKVTDPEWTQSGAALQAYWQRAAAIPEQGRPAITYDWFRQFLQYMLDNGWYTWFAKLIAWGEVLVGLGLLVGALVGIAAFFGTVMNFSFMLAGSASSNPVLFGLAVFLVLAWKVAGFWGLDRWLLPVLGTPWQRGALLGGELIEHGPCGGESSPAARIARKPRRGRDPGSGSRSPDQSTRNRNKEEMMSDVMGRVTRRGAMGILGTLGIGAIGTAVAPARQERGWERDSPQQTPGMRMRGP